MKLSCDIIRDLLPLYYDKVCSDDTNKVIEEHLEECESCSEILNLMNIEYQNVNTHTLDETFFYKKIHTFFMKKQIRLTLITFILCFILFFSFNYFISLFFIFYCFNKYFF